MSVNPNEGQQGQGYPGDQDYPGNQGYPPPPVGTYNAPTSGFNFQDMLQRWRTVLSIGFDSQRGIATFDAQQPAASWPAILWSLAILGAVEAVFNVITGFEYRNVTGTGPGVGTFIGGFISAYVGFFILAGILFIVAKLFSGTGTFLTYAFLLSLIYVPLEIISSVAGILPFLGGLVALAAGLYSIYLAIHATASSHRLSLGQSTAVVLIPIAVLFVLAVILTFTIGLALLAAYGLSR